MMLTCRGHGTHVVDGQLLATVCGGIKRVDRLVSVLPLKSRCEAEYSGYVRLAAADDSLAAGTPRR